MWFETYGWRPKMSCKECTLGDCGDCFYDGNDNCYVCEVFFPIEWLAKREFKDDDGNSCDYVTFHDEIYDYDSVESMMNDAIADGIELIIKEI